MRNMTGNRMQAALLLGALLPLFLNDLLLARAGTAAQYLAVDYVSRLLSLVCGVALFKAAGLAPADAGLRRVEAPVLLLAALLLLGLTVLLKAILLFLPDLSRYALIGPTPAPQGLLAYFDLGPGLLLVAFHEEFLFRGLLSALSRDRLNPVTAAMLCAVLFGLIHWGHGLNSVLFNTLFGLGLALAAHRTRSILPGALAHYVLDLFVFSRALLGF